MRKILFLILLVFFSFSFTTIKAFACDNFNLPQKVNTGETFNVNITKVVQGLSYTLSYAKGLGGAFINTQDSPKTATSDTISFSLKLDVSGTYQFMLSGKDGSTPKDSCVGNGAVVVQSTATPTPKGTAPPIIQVDFGTPTPTPSSVPWFLTGDWKCVQDPRGSFPTKGSCETQAAIQHPTPTPTKPPPPPPCTKSVDANGKSTFVCDTALGNISTNPADFVKWIFGIVLSLSGGVALILIIISGYRLMASGENPEKVQAMREQLTSAIIGLLFIIFSITILQIIGVDILHIPGFK